MDSYRAQKQVTQKLILENKDALIDPSTVTGGGAPPEPELKPLDEILKDWHQQWGNIDWKDKDKVEAILTKELPAMVAQDKAFQNARQNSDEPNARIEHDKALGRAMTSHPAGQDPFLPPDASAWIITLGIDPGPYRTEEGFTIPLLVAAPGDWIPGPREESFHGCHGEMLCSKCDGRSMRIPREWWEKWAWGAMAEGALYFTFGEGNGGLEE
jgi:hypothetical protein